jgi:AcrR family transcriptional regulator
MAESEPPRPALNIWQRPERASRGPAPEYSRAEIAAAAVTLADAEGLAATTMRRLAAQIGTAPASLYRYVTNRDELIALMTDAATAELSLSDLPSGSGWRADVLTVARQLRALYLKHPWLLEVMHGSSNVQHLIGPAAVDYLEGMAAALSELDLPARVTLEATAMLSGIVSLFVKDESSSSGGNVSEQAQASNAAYLGSIVAAGRHPHLAAVLARAGAEQTPETAQPEAIFERIVLGVMSGLLDPRPLPTLPDR